MTATDLLALVLKAWPAVSDLLLVLVGLGLGLARGAALRQTLYAAFRDPLQEKVSTVAVMVFGSWCACVAGFWVSVRVKPELLETTMMTLAGATLLLTGSAAGAKYLASKSGVRVDDTTTTTVSSSSTTVATIPKPGGGAP